MKKKMIIADNNIIDESKRDQIDESKTKELINKQ